MLTNRQLAFHCLPILFRYCIHNKESTVRIKWCIHSTQIIRLTLVLRKPFQTFSKLWDDWAILKSNSDTTQVLTLLSIHQWMLGICTGALSPQLSLRSARRWRSVTDKRVRLVGLLLHKQPSKEITSILATQEVFFLASAPATQNGQLGVRCDFY